MPTYDYQCTSCGHEFEIFQAMSDRPLGKCPKCNKKVRRLVSGGSGLIFKGSGFYLTDYARKDDSNDGKDKKTEKPKKSKKPEKKTKVKKEAS